MDAGLVLARFVHEASLLFLFGWAWSPAYLEAEPGRQPLRRLAAAALLVGFVSAVAWLIFTTASMAGVPVTGLDSATMVMGARDTDFGHLFLTRAALLLVLGLYALTPLPAPPRWLRLCLTGGLLASLALTGHAQAEEGGAHLVHAVADALHLLAAGLWLGGLAVLAAVLVEARRNNRPGPAWLALARFSWTGYVAVAGLIVSGLVNSWFLVGTPLALVTTTYGQLLTVKLVLFAAMLFLAARNRARSHAPVQEPPPVMQTRVAIELGLGLAALIIVALLGTLVPAAMT